ncbi:MAG: energy transducer TonB [Deltaproteobacteria bacterium]|nr:energy transducer TonB [Deltaproteobacteria bacterium]
MQLANGAAAEAPPSPEEALRVIPDFQGGAEGKDSPGSLSLLLQPAGTDWGGSDQPRGKDGFASQDAGKTPVEKVPFPAEPGEGILRQIVDRIEKAKRYPPLARKRGVEGTAVVRFKLNPAGTLESVEIARPSGSGLLDRASLETVRDAVPFPFHEGWLEVEIIFRIL